MPSVDDATLHDENYSEIGMIGMGSMGGGLTLLFSEHNSSVACFDVKMENVRTVLNNARQDKNVDFSRVRSYETLENLIKSFKPGRRRILVFSLPHGPTVDKVLDQLLPLLSQDDILIDCGNEWWEETIKRQGRCAGRGIRFVGCGVSGGYQSARRGPSMSPGCDKDTYRILEPYFKRWAAKAPSGDPCVRYIGPGGAGHYVKMIHNGIEQGFLSAICEAYGLLRIVLGLSNQEISDIFQTWTSKGELKGNYLLGIGFETLRFKEGEGDQNSEGIVDDVEDKVVQDVDNSEGTGVWTIKEMSERHSFGPTISAAHALRLMSSNKEQRLRVNENLKLPQSSRAREKDLNKVLWIEKIRKATYGAILASFIQGCNVIATQSNENGWKINLGDCLAIWRAGCIIESQYICDLLAPYYEQEPHSENAFFYAPAARDLAETYEPLKDVIKLAIDTDSVVPALSATLEYIKAVGGRNLPTNFEETEMDYFGHHNYDLKREKKFSPKIGGHHTEWKPA